MSGTSTPGSKVYAQIVASSLRILEGTSTSEGSAYLRRLSREQLLSKRRAAEKSRSFETTCRVAHRLVALAAEDAAKSRTLRAHRAAVESFIELLRATQDLQPVSGASVQALANLLWEGLPEPSGRLRAFLGKRRREVTARDIEAAYPLTPEEWQSLVGAVQRETLRLTDPVSFVTDDHQRPFVELDAAGRLARLAEQEVVPVAPTTAYDTSERELRVTSVTALGFRGAPHQVQLDLTKAGKPVDILLWGDNGTGKSTIADALEFALQARVDRSADFISSLRPSVRNLHAARTLSSVSLTDGSTVLRELRVAPDGRARASDDPIRPGFRIAPIVIRRADIIRFLDTGSLDRGTIFFDYFPDVHGGVGTRPTEEIRSLEDEQYQLRVARTDLARRLHTLVDAPDFDFTSRTQLDRYLAVMTSGVQRQSENPKPVGLSEGVKAVVAELRSVQERLALVKKKVQAGVQSLNPIAYREQLQRIMPALTVIEEELSRAFREITGAEHVDAIRLLVGQSGPVSLDVVVQFSDGRTALPQQVFSEGYKDLLAMLVFLLMSKQAAAAGQARFLVLDDALQSVNATVRVGLMNYLLTQFSDWQLIITGHDRSWLTQLRALYHRRGRSFVEKATLTWSFDRGLRLAGESRSVSDSLRSAMLANDARQTAAGAGMLLEQMCHELSWRLRISVQRKENDRYTLGDLWPGIRKALARTPVCAEVEQIDLRVDLRNSVGAHFNDWADDVPWSDVETLGINTLSLFERVNCSACADWVAAGPSGMRCRCGALTL